MPRVLRQGATLSLSFTRIVWSVFPPSITTMRCWLSWQQSSPAILRVRKSWNQHFETNWSPYPISSMLIGCTSREMRFDWLLEVVYHCLQNRCVDWCDGHVSFNACGEVCLDNHNPWELFSPERFRTTLEFDNTRRQCALQFSGIPFLLYDCIHSI